MSTGFIGNRPGPQSTPQALAPLPRGHLHLLQQFADEGGAGTLDRHGRIMVGHDGHTLPGDAIAWLQIVSRGLIEGREGKIVLTDSGRQTVAGIKAANEARTAVL